MKIIINNTFCGDWGDSDFASSCPNLGSCKDYVAYNPGMFSEAYWLINSIKIYE